MSLPNELNVALKEWHVVTRALGSGIQTILLRKGGIQETSGEFEVEHRQFLLFPTFLHQNLKMLKPEVHAQFQEHAVEPATISIELAAEVTDIIQLASRQQLQDLDAEHVWTRALIDKRFDYKPQKPLYLLIVRTFRLNKPAAIQNTHAYAGCVSWVPLEAPIDCREATPAIADDRFEQRRRHIRETIAAAPT
jgi:hypothetical protein